MRLLAGWRKWVFALGLTTAATPVAALSCKNRSDTDVAPAHHGGSRADGGVVIPAVPASDPCERAGYVFDGTSDCNVVRCPELVCECPPLAASGVSSGLDSPIEITLSACAAGAGCLSAANCSRVCDPALALQKAACDARIQGAQNCTHESDCREGQCREEIVGSICVEPMGCSEDGDCSEGSVCRFDPNTLDPETSLPLQLGRCSTGALGAYCYDDGHCVFGKCQSGTCTGGLENEACEFNSNCALGFCRITSVPEGTGSCTSGARGGACVDDGDCGHGLHCVTNICAGNGTGDFCTEDSQCMSQVCIAGRCRAGELGSQCEQATDCDNAFCVGSYCVSGQMLSPCTDSTDCKSGFACARNVCSDGSVGSPCLSVADCQVLACVRGSCSAGDNGFECDQDNECASSRCAKPAGAAVGECTSGAVGSACIDSDDCTSNDCGVQNVCN